MKVLQKDKKRKSKVMQRTPVMTREQYTALDLDSRLALIGALIPLGLMLESEELRLEVQQLAGSRCQRKDGPRREQRNRIGNGG